MYGGKQNPTFVCVCKYVYDVIHKTEVGYGTCRSVDDNLFRSVQCINTAANRAVIDRRFRPRLCHLGSYFKRPQSSPTRLLACNRYYCAQFIAKPKAACVLRFS